MVGSTAIWSNSSFLTTRAIRPGPSPSPSKSWPTGGRSSSSVTAPVPNRSPRLQSTPRQRSPRSRARRQRTASLRTIPGISAPSLTIAHKGYSLRPTPAYVLNADHLSIVAGNTDYGKSLAASIIEGFRPHGEVRNLLEVDMVGGREEETLNAAVAKLKADPDPGLIVLALLGDPAAKALEALKAEGITAPVIGGDALASDSLLASVTHSVGQESAWDGLISAAPLMMDSLTSDALRFSDAYQQAFGLEPTWRSATTFDAAIAATTAMRAAGVTGAANDREGERQRIRDALAAMDSPEHAVPGLLGPIYFDKHQTTPRAAVFGVARGQSSNPPSSNCARIVDRRQRDWKRTSLAVRPSRSMARSWNGSGWSLPALNSTRLASLTRQILASMPISFSGSPIQATIPQRILPS